MTKKLLCIIVLMLALVCAFASCDNNKSDTPSTPEPPTHTHTFGEWVTTKEKTCTENGMKERVCSCGKIETETVYCTGHTNPSPWGCYDCKEGWVTIDLPATPLIVYSYNDAFKITELKYALGRDDSGYIFKLIYSGEKIIGDSNTSIFFDIKVIDSEGYVIFSKPIATEKLTVGDKLKDSGELVYNAKLDPSKTYTLTISGD